MSPYWQVPHRLVSVSDAGGVDLYCSDCGKHLKTFDPNQSVTLKSLWSVKHDCKHTKEKS